MSCVAMIFAAGLGTRLYPLTADKPKALVEVCGKPLLEHIINKLISNGFDDIVINVHHFGEKIIDYISKKNFNADICISDERQELLDTAGGLKFAEPLFHGADDILMYNVDILSDIDLRVFYQYHQKNDALATLAVKNRETSRYFVFDRENMQLIGWKDIKSGEVKKSHEFGDGVELAFSGIHIVKKEILNYIPSGKKISMTPLYLELAAEHKIIAYDHSHDSWCDVGKIDVVERLNGQVH